VVGGRAKVGQAVPEGRLAWGGGAALRS
jgi:hypothetical protein